MAISNFYEKFFSDQRRQWLAVELGLPEQLAVGPLAYLWREVTKSGRVIMSAERIDRIAGVKGYAEALLKSELAREEDGGIYLCGTREYCAWRQAQRERGAKGGQQTAANRAAAKQPQQDTGHTVARRRRTKSVASDQQVSSESVAVEQHSSSSRVTNATLQSSAGCIDASETLPVLSSSFSVLSSEFLVPNSLFLNTPDGSAVASRTISTEVDDWAEGTAPQQTLKLVADEERRTPEGSELRDAIDLFDAAFRKASGGQKPTWGAKQVAQVKGLLKRHGYDVFVNRVRILFERTPAWLSRDGTTPDLGTLISNYDRLAERVSKPSSAMSQTERLLAYADELRARGE